MERTRRVARVLLASLVLLVIIFLAVREDPGVPDALLASVPTKVTRDGLETPALRQQPTSSTNAQLSGGVLLCSPPPPAPSPAPPASVSPVPVSSPMTVLETLRAGISAAVPPRQRDCCPVPGVACQRRPWAHHQGAPRACIVGPYERDFAHIASLARNTAGPGFAYVRYNDGERDVMEDREIGNGEWRVAEGQAPKMRQVWPIHCHWL
jgi:hypothetical protein